MMSHNIRCSMLPGLLALALLLTSGGCSQQDQAGDRTAAKMAAGQTQDSLVITLVAIDSTNVLDLLRAGHEVEAKGTPLGSFVTSVDGVANGGGCYWLFSVNGVMALEASDRVIAAPSDTIRWHFRRL